MASIRFRSIIEIAELEEMLGDLVRQLASGTASITHNGNSVSYSSPAQIRLAIEEIEREIARREATAAGAKRGRAPLTPFYPSMPGKGF